MQVSLVTTVVNEAADIVGFLESIAAQTRPPDDIVLVDGGSTDGTLELARAFLATTDLPARVILMPGANRSQARNAGIRTAHGDIIAMTDAGCRLHPDWLAHLVAAFERDPDCELAAGFYETQADSPAERLVALAMVPTATELTPEAFLPSSRSVAFRRRVWERVGGYPEANPFSEDTEFDLAVRATGARMTFVREATVRWRQEARPWRIFRRFFRYARGDAAAGIFPRAYRRVWTQFAVGSALGALAFRWPRAWGLLAAGVVAYFFHCGRKAHYRGARGWEPLVSPLVNLWVDIAHLCGTAVGVLERRR